MAGTPEARNRGIDVEPDVPTDLRAVVVRYDGGPDRCTVSPRDVDEAHRLTRWLSVDADVLVPLEAMC
ncbi:DUF7511 domain-containing protein [Halorarum salinum]|uniref:DUF7511 domain-containing protein n=1 Tax=Halorarum salinum TaxID=2743089 RepID=A0A7D5L8H9_9EURY|nr:hypothetical protein [Halobaculum salinum]QLG60235.1 hypothetical protein HUG12_16595 [Halobaculum salinum]